MTSRRGGYFKNGPVYARGCLERKLLLRMQAAAYNASCCSECRGVPRLSVVEYPSNVPPAKVNVEHIHLRRDLEDTLKKAKNIEKGVIDFQNLMVNFYFLSALYWNRPYEA